MNPLVKKEIRLLLPSWLTVLALEALAPWFLKNPDTAFAFVPAVFFFGMIVLAIDSFGREFSLGTYQSLMSHPIERRQIWRTKISVLSLAVALIFLAYFTSCVQRFHLAAHHPMWGITPTDFRGEFNYAMFMSIAALFVALSGGLWAALFLRQIAAAFWISLLVPMGMLMLTSLLLPVRLVINSYFVIPLLCSLAAIYSAAGFWLAHRLFYQSQDATWTGGVINFSRWRYFESGSQAAISIRRHRPIVALLKKEFQLHSISLICAGALLVGHVAVILIRKVHGNFGRNSLAGTVSEFYWALWLVLPLVIGCTTAAEERRIGVMEQQFCLPATRRFQFAIKFLPALFFGLVLGGAMPFLLEGLAAFIGAPNPDFKFNSPTASLAPFITVAGFALASSLAALFATTLTKNIPQAMGAAVATIIGCCLFTYCIGRFHQFLANPWYRPTLTFGIAILTALVVFPWLTYANFKYFLEGGRMWRRNVFGLAGAILFILASSPAIYNRAWEVFEPAEPAHGPAKLSLANPPVIHNDGLFNGDLLVRLPDGRVWFDAVGFPQSEHKLLNEIRTTFNPFPISLGPQRFVPGSNWVSYVIRHIDNWLSTSTHITGYLETVGIKSDGTLWVSAKSDSPRWTEGRLTQFGDESNWQAVAWFPNSLSVLLLKRDGTLWCWGTNQWNWHQPPSLWPALRNFSPDQVGTNSDWKEISSNGAHLEATDGSVWSLWIDPKTGKGHLWRDTNFDQVDINRLSLVGGTDIGGYIRNDGTLWIRGNAPPESNVGSETFQCGKGTNWVSVADGGWSWLIALKSDGTLWQKTRNRFSPQSAGAFSSPLTRLGIHSDWVALTSVRYGVISVAADGSVWLWPDRTQYQYEQLLLKPPKQPEFLGNVFGKGY